MDTGVSFLCTLHCEGMFFIWYFKYLYVAQGITKTGRIAYVSSTKVA